VTRRVLLTVVAVCAVGVTVFFVPMALLVREQHRRTDVLEMQHLAAVAARSVPVGVGATASWRPADPKRHHRYALYDAAGRRLTGAGPDPADPTVIRALRGALASGVTDSEIVAATALGVGTEVTGAVRVAEPARQSAERTAASLAWMSALALGAVTVAALAGWWLLQRLLGPVATLRAAAERLGGGDFTVQIPATGLAELDDLGRALTLSAQRIGGLVVRERAFSADASHELRTPLAAVIVALETELLAPRPDRRAVLTEALEALMRLERTVADLLALARDAPDQRGELDLCELLDRLRGDWNPAYQDAGRALQVHCAQVPVVHASGVAVRHVLDVLVDNALRHGRGAVAVVAVPVPGGLTVTVTDAGPGPAHPATLFARRDPDATGTGIGLALARSLAEAEGARLRLRTGSPTTFEFLIPGTAPGVRLGIEPARRDLDHRVRPQPRGS
jgi:signal transduction histidine kinase